ncbi:hypothetical protein B0P06_005304 [Clostridium saccharoperbutylacetonicum]|uniref:Uncharacterized protein n=1 Tax=Clostridium saccharoperbutylacetonicum N1-4(HMT) TaxID=931276 RepID=M1LTR6_9CLOT|nr:hypothetical protein [Clostridium saccharoperbutylacetonicum]AGF56430.1 hypothetical protein Cspa_c26650 [Clostridium saccharoperbutylacetonicum N1-4(HMT)]NRT62825.1 hypothetical protein [Clostridium saccharoperbutylacetonicum]NSB26179.1 hypothetical protein [Clostridium saccharoperbutylacetonicum]NSB45533.1 hypothetical protein [Clostridium saccharoperbutylacetonicum]
MIKVKDVAKTMTLKDFQKRFTQENQGIKDNLTRKIYFCIYDFGFKVSQEDCLEVRDCKECMNEAIEYLKFRNNSRENKKYEQSSFDR